MSIIDEKDCEILNILQEDCRMTLTDIAKIIKLSVDSTKKRVEKLKTKGVYNPKIQIRPRQIGFPNIVDVKIKLRNYNDKRINEFINYTIGHSRIAEVFSISGEWNFTLVIIAKDHEDLGLITEEIRKKFADIISEWSESLTKTAYKFEKYDLVKLMGYKT